VASKDTVNDPTYLGHLALAYDYMHVEIE